MVVAGLQWSLQRRPSGGDSRAFVSPPCLCCCLTNPLVVNGWGSTLMTLYNPSQPPDTIRLSFCPLNTSVAIKLQQELQRGQNLLQTALFSYIVCSEVFSQFYSQKPQTGSNSNKGNLFPTKPKIYTYLRQYRVSTGQTRCPVGQKHGDYTLVCVYLEAAV